MIRPPVSRRAGRSVLSAIVLVAVTLVVAATTATAQETEEAAPVQFEQDIQPFFNQQCYACHLRGAEPGGLALEPGIAYEELVGMESTQSDLLRVAPGEPEASYLVHKLRGTHLEVGGEGARMPQGGVGVTETVLDAIVRWIEAGAPAE